MCALFEKFSMFLLSVIWCIAQSTCTTTCGLTKQLIGVEWLDKRKTCILKASIKFQLYVGDVGVAARQALNRLSPKLRPTANL